MAERSAFDPKNIIDSTAEKHGLLEELNLPPQVIAFIRTNARNLQIAVGCLLVAILAWNFYSQYVEKKENAATALLAQAMDKSGVDRQATLDEVGQKFSGTGAAVWGMIEKANLAADAGNWGEATASYKKALAELDSSSPIVPLVQLSLAQAHENNKEYAEAMTIYQGLSDAAGFKAQALQGVARVHESQGELQKAKETYEGMLADQDLSARVREEVAQRLAHF